MEWNLTEPECLTTAMLCLPRSFTSNARHGVWVTTAGSGGCGGSESYQRPVLEGPPVSLRVSGKFPDSCRHHYGDSGFL